MGHFRCVTRSMKEQEYNGLTERSNSRILRRPESQVYPVTERSFERGASPVVNQNLKQRMFVEEEFTQDFNVNSEEVWVVQGPVLKKPTTRAEKMQLHNERWIDWETTVEQLYQSKYITLAQVQALKKHPDLRNKFRKTCKRRLNLENSPLTKSFTSGRSVAVFRSDIAILTSQQLIDEYFKKKSEDRISYQKMKVKLKHQEAELERLRNQVEHLAVKYKHCKCT